MTTAEVVMAATPPEERFVSPLAMYG